MDGVIGTILLFAGNFAPRGWALCQGQLMPISQYQALFSILGTTYGGDGRTTFALPDLRGRMAIQQGQGPGLQHYQLGARGGVENVTLTQTQIPTHSHTGTVKINTGPDTQITNVSEGNIFAHDAKRGADALPIYTSQGPNATMNDQAASLTINPSVGGGQGHENRPPFLALNYVICLVGTFPSRS